MNETIDFANVPLWIRNQVRKDLAPFQGKPISLAQLQNSFEKTPLDALFVKFSIIDNQVYTEKKWTDNLIDYRVSAFVEALHKLCTIIKFPDLCFLCSMHDAASYSLSLVEENLPIFVMCKERDDNRFVLLPDHEALRAKFQVLSGKDLTKYETLWTKKKPQLIWRGSTAQGPKVTEENLHLFSRIKLCKLSKDYPLLIDAKFTIYVQGAESIPSLRNFEGNLVDYETLMLYKYHILIDGNASSYSRSGWKFFSNSLIFKPESLWIQWYYNELKPYVHYVPVNKNLDDLVEKIEWAKKNDNLVKQIAQNARVFALNKLTLSTNLLYLYFVLSEYASLGFVE